MTVSKKKINKEIVILALIIISVVISITIDFKHLVLIYVDNLSDIYLTLLQIQSSIATISIAITSLLSNVISEEYYGISVSNYYLNIKPLLFKQKVVVISSILLIVLNVFFYIFVFYNTMMIIFITSCVLIIFSIVEIYTAFKGRRTISDEINEYVNEVFFNCKFSYENKIEVFINYLRTWPNLIANKVDYDYETERYKKVLPELLNLKAENTLNVIQKETSIVIKRLISNNDIIIKTRGYELFENTLLIVWRYIQSNEFKHIDNDFDIYSECECEIAQCLEELPYKDFKENINWERLVDLISKLFIFCHGDNKTDISSLSEHSKQLREIPIYYVSALSNKIKSENINIYSEKGYGVPYLSIDLNVSSEVEKEYSKIKRQCIFAYFSSLLSNNQIGILLTRNKRYSIYYSRNRYNNIILCLIIICYIYYIYAYETPACVTNLEKEDAVLVLSRIKDDGIFNEAILTLINEKNNIFEELVDELKSVLELSEKKPLDGSSKICIIHHAINDFIILLCVMLCAYKKDGQIEKVLQKNMSAYSWYMQYFGGNRDRTINKLNNMFDELTKKEDEHTSDLIEYGISELEIKLSKLYKSEILEKVHQNKKSFEEIEKNVSSINDLQEHIKNELNQRFKSWTKDADTNCYEVNVSLIQFELSRDILQNSELYYVMPNMEFNFLKAVGIYFVKNRNLDLFERNKDNDEEYFNILNEKELLLVGPEYVLCNHQKEKKNHFDVVSSKCTKINTAIGNAGLVLTDKLPINIKNVTLSKVVPKLDDIDYHYDSVNDVYKYSPNPGVILEFTEDELKCYLENKKLVFEIELTLKISNDLSKYGYLVYVTNN